jgi:hypothetical protein
MHRVLEPKPHPSKECGNTTKRSGGYRESQLEIEMLRTRCRGRVRRRVLVVAMKRKVVLSSTGWGGVEPMPQQYTVPSGEAR